MASVLRRAEAGDWSPRVTWPWWEALGVLAVALVAGAGIRERLFEPASTVGEAFLARTVVESTWLVVLLAWIVVRRHAWGAAVGRWTRARAEIVDAAVFGALLNGAVVVLVILALRSLLDVAARARFEGAARDVTSMAPLDAISVLAFALVVAPAIEELAFRGVLFRGFRDRLGVGAGVVVSALAFGAIHWVPFGSAEGALSAASTTAMGVGLAIQYERRRTLLAPIVAHASFNAVGLLAALR
jgi:hypothetical protein